MEGLEFNNEKVYDEKIEKINYGNLEDFTLILTHQIQYSDLDHYGHKYLVLMMNALALKENEEFVEVQVDYINQGYLGRKIDIYKKKVDNIYYLVGKDEDNVIFAIKASVSA